MQYREEFFDEAVGDMRELLGMPTACTVEVVLAAKEWLKFAKFVREQAAWSQAAFGSDAERGPQGPFKHLAKEVQEALESPADATEYVDCLFLVCDAARRAGFTFPGLLDAALTKLEVNKQRKWPKPSNNQEPVEHERS